MLKKILIAIFIIILLILLGLWSPWNKWNINILQFFGIQTKQEFSILKVHSLAGQIDIYVDEQLKGKATAEELFTEISPIEPGEHIVKLVREGDTENQFATITRKLSFEAGLEVVIAYEIGPTEQFSEGHILYGKKSFTGDDSTTLDIYVQPTASKITMDGIAIGESPRKSVKLDISKQHTLAFTKDGYDSFQIDILSDQQAERDKLKNINLTLEVNLFPRPISITN